MNAPADKLPPVGSQARLRRDVERYPHFHIEAGASGTIMAAEERLISL